LQRSDDDDDDGDYSPRALNGGGSLESTHSFLSPVLPPKNNGTKGFGAVSCSPSEMLRPHSSAIGSSEEHLESVHTEIFHASPVQTHFLPASLFTNASASGCQHPTSSTPRVAAVGGGVVRRRSWRTHYVRPNRTAELIRRERDNEDVVGYTNRSIPMCRRSIPVIIASTHSRSLTSPGKSRTIESPPLEHRSETASCGSGAKITSHSRIVHF
uniref:Pecanex-like protein n=1 Tax=Gongylonema pulchrum TaxID=637853 RepID=A0A183CVX2_9BILA